MSVCTFIASDLPLQEVAPVQHYPVYIDIDKQTVFDGGADDKFSLCEFKSVTDYTSRKYGVCLEWNYTDGRARQIIKYIKNALNEAETIELWHVWLMDHYEFEERPYIHRKRICLDELKLEILRELDDAPIWNKPDKHYPDRPSFYCLTITR